MMNRRQLLGLFGKSAAGLYLATNVKCVPLGHMIDLMTRDGSVSSFSDNGVDQIVDPGYTTNDHPASNCANPSILCPSDLSGLGLGGVDENTGWTAFYALSREMLPQGNSPNLDLNQMLPFAYDPGCGRLVLRANILYPINQKVIGEAGILIGPEQLVGSSAGMLWRSYVFITDPSAKQYPDVAGGESIMCESTTLPKQEGMQLVGHFNNDQTADWYIGTGLETRFNYRAVEPEYDRYALFQSGNVTPGVAGWRAQKLVDVQARGFTIDQLLADPLYAQSQGINLIPDERALKVMVKQFVNADPYSLMDKQI